MVLVVSYQQPSYSEVWMERMTNMLRPDVEAAYVLRRNPNSVQTNGLRVRYLLPGFMSPFPSRLAAKLGRRWIDREMSQVLKSTGKSTDVLVHYLTMAVSIENAIYNCPNPVFVHCHGFDVTWNKKNERFPFLLDHGKSYVQRVRSLAKRVTLIANSNCTAEKLKDIGIPDSRIAIKNYGVPVPLVCRRSCEFHHTDVSILYLGRLTDFKGPVETIRAFGYARELGLKGRLILAGGGLLKKACEQEVLRLGLAQYVELLGPVSATRAAELMATADIFTAHNQRSLQTGQEEAFGVSIVEAMANGIPVVTGRSGGVCETVLDGETGILVTPGDIQSHGEALLRLAQDPVLQHTMGKRGYERARDHFSLEREEQRLKEIFAFNRQPLLDSPRDNSDIANCNDASQRSGE